MSRHVGDVSRNTTFMPGGTGIALSTDAPETSMLSLVLLVACGPDLPAGWEEAEPIPDFHQAACAGDPYGDYEPVVTAEQSDGGLAITYEKAHFRCEQDVEGFFKVEGDTLAVLVQPIDMNPSMVAACDCLYTLDMGVGATGTTVEMWRRWDNLNDPNDPELVDTVEVSE